MNERTTKREWMRIKGAVSPASLSKLVVVTGLAPGNILILVEITELDGDVVNRRPVQLSELETFTP